MSADPTGHLLVADDDRINHHLLGRQLEKDGHTVSVAENGRRALEMLEEEDFDLVLLDIVMPEMDGMEVLEKVRETRSEAELPVIMVTSRSERVHVVKALEMGANDYITKPIDLAVVRARVRTQLRLKRLAELKDEFLRIASHDLKNPITSIRGFAYLLTTLLPSGVAMTEQAIGFISRIDRTTQIMQHIVEDFLDFQSIQDGKVQLNLQPLDLCELAHDVVENNRAYAQSKQVPVSLEFEEDLPPLQADSSRLSQVLQNLVSNAIKFSPPEAVVRVRASCREGNVLLEVIDEGPGLTDEDLGKTFVKYARLSNKPTGGEKSSGLGLAICKQLIELHLGRIGVHNNPNRGCTFWFEVPVEQLGACGQ